MVNKTHIAVLGAGSWGTALAVLLAKNGHDVCLWGRAEDGMASMQAERCNRRYLPEITFPSSLNASDDLAAVMGQAQLVLLAVPSSAFSAVLTTISPYLNVDDHTLLWATKGLDHDRGCLLHELVEEQCPAGMSSAIVSGPTFAAEVAAGLPTAVTVASSDIKYAQFVAGLLVNDRFRVYTSSDVIGVELGGAVKNVLAIAAGIADGLGFGANTRAALVTRGLNEMMRLGLAMGGQAETFMGLAGMGDLVLTCTDNQSRNRRFGLALGRCGNVREAKKDIDQVIEGVQTASLIFKLAKEKGIDMPIVEQVYSVLYEGKDLREAVNSLFARDMKAEALPA